MDQYCPISGFRVETRPEWTQIPLSSRAWISFRKIGSHIVDIYTEGERSAETQTPFERARERVIREAFPDHTPYVELYDLSGLSSLPSAEVRRRHTNYVTSRAFEDCKGSFVYGGSRVVRGIYKVGLALQGVDLSYPLYVVKDYREAMLGAEALVRDYLTYTAPHTPLSERAFAFSSDWGLWTRDGGGRFEISASRGQVLYERLIGDLRGSVYGELRSLLQKLITEGRLRCRQVYCIGDFSGVLSVSEEFVESFIQAYREFFEENRIELTQFYVIAEESWKKEIIRRAQQYIALPTVYIRNAGEAFRDIQHMLVPVLSDDKGKTNLTHPPVVIDRQDWDKFVKMLGNLAWENDLPEDAAFPENHPLHEAVAAYRLIREDYRAVIRRHRDAEEAARAASQTKSLFLANMSHEIRTPLNGVVGMLQILQDEMLSAEQREQLSVARTCADSLMTLINDILDLSKIEAGKMPLESIRFDLRSLMEQLNAVMRPMAEKKGLTYSCAIQENVPRVLLGDPARLRQILTNLVGNAIKFTAKGSVSVGVALVADDPVLCTARFEVCDTGIGIPLDQQQKIFEAFQQADVTVSRVYGGTGLGLTICKELVNLMRGDIGVQSEPGRGSAFWVRIPFQKTLDGLRESYAGSPERVSAGGQSQQGARILVVEDNAVNQKVALMLLKKIGYQAELAADGAQALDYLRQKSYDLVFMDCRMPVLDGYEATRAIRAFPDGHVNRRVPIVAMTANAMEGDRHKCLACGMDDFLEKPVQLTQLQKILEKWLKRPN